MVGAATKIAFAAFATGASVALAKGILGLGNGLAPAGGSLLRSFTTTASAAAALATFTAACVMGGARSGGGGIVLAEGREAGNDLSEGRGLS